jgi:F420-dependent oxidoreductase-like protein
MATIRFGVCLPQFDASWSQVVEAARAADEYGFDSVWAVDHFIGFPDANQPVFEGWTQIAAVAALTSRVRLGHLVLCIGYRSPALLAKIKAPHDAVSNGRLIVGLGAGWYLTEYEQYGYDFPPIRTRLEQLGDTLEILRAMWTQERATVTGRHFTVRDALCNPKPVQPRVPILIGGGGEKVLLRLVARHADIWNNLGAYHADVARKRDILAQHCRTEGRDPAEITISQQTVAAIGTDAATASRRTAQIFNEVPFLEGAPDLALTGTPDQIHQRIETNRKLGITTYMMSFGRTLDPEQLRLFGREIVAAYR